VYNAKLDSAFASSGGGGFDGGGGGGGGAGGFHHGGGFQGGGFSGGGFQGFPGGDFNFGDFFNEQGAFTRLVSEDALSYTSERRQVPSIAMTSYYAHEEHYQPEILSPACVSVDIGGRGGFGRGPPQRKVRREQSAEH
jgi:hypothetical protein